MLIFKVFVTLPLQFNDNNRGKKKKKKTLGEQNYIQVCQSKFIFTPLHACVCYVSQPNSLPRDGPRTARWIWVKGSTKSLRFLQHVEAENEHEGNDLNSAWELANLKAEDSISLHSMLLHC